MGCREKRLCRAGIVSGVKQCSVVTLLHGPGPGDTEVCGTGIAIMVQNILCTLHVTRDVHVVRNRPCLKKEFILLVVKKIKKACDTHYFCNDIPCVAGGSSRASQLSFSSSHLSLCQCFNIVR